ncbi:MAG: hypothetical protein M3376_06205, partial [Actinomycetota bacterium]|nr:hypothetical protein [Actinomycetota bacterium]
MDESMFDRRFMVVDADARIDDVLALAGDLSPTRIVIREARASEAPDDGDDLDVADVYFVIDPNDLPTDLAPETTIGRMLGAMSAEPAGVVDYGAAWNAEMLSVRRSAGPAVVLDEGVVTAVLPDLAAGDDP